MADAPKVLLCDCTGTMRLDSAALSAATGLDCSRVHTHLCGPEAGTALRAMQTGAPMVVACGQMATFFEDLAEDAGLDAPLAIDIRDRAGWSEDDAGPKMAALLAAGMRPRPAVPTRDVTSDGVCLVLGHGETAIAAAKQLSGALTVTCLLASGDAEDPVGFDLAAGRIRTAIGTLGAFTVTVDGYAPLTEAGRGARTFGPATNGAVSECDLIVDLTGSSALFPAPEKRDGYLRADPGDPLAIARTLFDAAQLTGTFEKPMHIRFAADLCAHSRAGQPACSRCLDLCPTGAITPDGDTVKIDPMVCAGCGACAAVCPTGAASTDDPPVQWLFDTLRILAETYTKAGGTLPRLLVHDDHGAEMIRLAARYGRGLPGSVIPLELPSLNAFGHAEMLAARALGFADVTILLAPRTERPALEAETALADAIAGAGRITLLDIADPDALSETLYDAAPAPHTVTPIAALGGRREVTRTAAKALGATGAIALPAGAPYGAVQVNTDTCTLCMSCAGLCPTGALGDNPDRPELTFRETACVQCGLCAGLCPEKAITLVPQLNVEDSALAPTVLNEEEPFACIECGALFGVKSTIERITEKLVGINPMFTNSDNARLIQMCDDCRVRSQYHADAQPMFAGHRPRVRTTEDYLNEGNDDT